MVPFTKVKRLSKERANSDPTGHGLGPNLWSLRPRDLPSKKILALPEFADLESNPVFRALVFRKRAENKKRIFWIALNFLGWLVGGTIYLQLVMNVSLERAIVIVPATVVTVMIGIANIYVLAGIEGYETNGALKPFFRDVVESGVDGRAIASGIWGKTVSGYPLGLIALLLASGVAVLVYAVLFGALGPSAHVDALMARFWALGIFGAFHLFAALRFLPWVTLPGTLVLLRSVRQSYERNLNERDRPPIVPLLRWIRFILFVTISLGIVLVPFALYAGFASAKDLFYHSSNTPVPTALFCTTSAFFASTGIVTGTLWGTWAKLTAPRRFERFAEEMARLFDLRRRWLNDD